MRFYCQCLNVTIDVFELDNQQESLRQFLPVDFCEEWNEFHLLSDRAVHIVWQSLYQSISMRDMKLNRCLACNQYTHVTNLEFNRILVNKNLLNETTVKDAYDNPNYSKVTKILLPTTTASSPLTSLSTSQNEKFQREYELVQQLYRQSIEDVDREIEEKIQTYQHEQEQFLKTKTEEINKELGLFLSFMRAIPRQASSTKPPPISQTSITYLNENSMESGLGSDIFDTNGIDLSRQSSMIERTYSERTSNIDDEPNDDLSFDNAAYDTISNFATSMPKDISFHPYSIPQQNIDRNDDSTNLERIGKSFRELSQSLMCTDGTELFGDLPSPRLNAR
ncbi:unnamed protein product [Adineta ricciae]|uniref:Uncharacterized protein n=1 Tax=Adineta ricciae TaxID=249248 RepID=A0A814MJL2_ADIRI|nr:unnamed protein product [Adineta ricciae]CAF1081783.1 unnamed protein product [Adineta ricciae]